MNVGIVSKRNGGRSECKRSENWEKRDERKKSAPEVGGGGIMMIMMMLKIMISLLSCLII